MSATLSPPIGPEQAALIQRRVSVIVASRDARHRPHLMRAVGCRLRDDWCELTVFMSTAASEQVLADLRANGLIAVVFSQPTTSHTVQLKGRDARVHALQPGDAGLIQDYLDNFIEEVAAIGFPAHVARAVLGHAPDDVVAVSFTPSSAFEQTPGPQAGHAIQP
jgi:pyridoxamine 5'-phosphate oxidase-like protein